MAGILGSIAASTGPVVGSGAGPNGNGTSGTAGPTPPSPNHPVKQIPPLGAQPQTAGDLLSATPQQAAANAAGPAIHSNQAINEALMQAFRPVIPDQINSLLGPAIGAIQGHTAPIAFYQPRQAAPIQNKRNS